MWKGFSDEERAKWNSKAKQPANKSNQTAELNIEDVELTNESEATSTPTKTSTSTSTPTKTSTSTLTKISTRTSTRKRKRKDNGKDKVSSSEQEDANYEEGKDDEDASETGDGINSAPKKQRPAKQSVRVKFTSTKAFEKVFGPHCTRRVCSGGLTVLGHRSLTVEMVCTPKIPITVEYSSRRLCVSYVHRASYTYK